MSEIPPSVFSKRSFIFFILLAPACVLAVVAIVLTLQYKQFQAMVAPATTVAEFAWTPESRQRLETLLASIRSFSETATDTASKADADTLRFTPDDLTVLVASSHVTASEHMRFRFGSTVTRNKDTLLTVESSQPVTALNGKFAWIFKRIAQMKDGWLNARMEGLPEVKAGPPRALDFTVENGFLNNGRVPRAALMKRAGLSPKDFLDPQLAPEYAAFVNAIDTAYFHTDAVYLVRRAR